MNEFISKPKRPFVTKVNALADYQLHLTFENGEVRILDMKPYLVGVFTELKDPEYFDRVRIDQGSVVWPDGQALAYDMLYYKSKSSTVLN